MASTPLGPFLDDPWVTRVYTGPDRPSPQRAAELDRILELETRVRRLGIWDSYIAHLDQILGTEPNLRHLASYGQRWEAARLAAQEKDAAS
jgi:hypothetical protein